MENKVLCVCLSDWCKQSNKRTFDGQCNTCGIELVKSKRGNLGSSIMVACKCTLSRLHVWGVYYHPDCRFVEPTAKEDKDVERFPFFLDNLPKEEQQEVRAKYFETHEPEFSKCAACGSTASKFCKGCRCVIYCNAECQLAHWQKHREFCKSHQFISSKACKCFNAEEKMYHTRYENGMCCLDTCDKVVDANTPQRLAMMISNCTKKNGGTHILPKIFCSNACLNLDTKKHEKK